jgi:hypothetical protein
MRGGCRRLSKLPLQRRGFDDSARLLLLYLIHASVLAGIYWPW